MFAAGYRGRWFPFLLQEQTKVAVIAGTSEAAFAGNVTRDQKDARPAIRVCEIPYGAQGGNSDYAAPSGASSSEINARAADFRPLIAI